MNARFLLPRLTMALVLGAIVSSMIHVPVADAAPATLAGSAIVTVELPDVSGSPPQIIVKTLLPETREPVGTCVYSKVLAHPGGGHYVTARLTNLPLNTELDISVSTPIPPGALSHPGFAHLLIFRPVTSYDRGMAYPITLLGPAPAGSVTFRPDDLEVVPPEPPPDPSPAASAAPVPSSATSPSTPASAATAPVHS